MKQELQKTFRNPPALYRGAPFWSWNCRLDKDQLLRQIGCFKQMGLGGFHIHSRTGLDTEYLSDEFMEMVRTCTAHAKDNQMLAWLYDEDRWPSGAAGGIVTKDERFRARHLLFTPTPYAGKNQNQVHQNSTAGGCRYENGELLAVYAVTLSAGRLANYRRINSKADATAGEVVWYAYLEAAKPSDWFNNQTYVDTMNPEAIKRFIEVTHERYAETVGEEFGKVVPAIFTDEPQFVHKQHLNHAADLADVVIPWTPDFADSFAKTFSGNILDYLPEVFWELADGQASAWRYRYHDHIAERFASAFADTIGGWCRDHNIALTGHMMSENSLASQTAAIGDAMRSYRGFDIPGIDILCDWMESEYSTAKQAQSAAHQYGCSGVLSELYGVTNWDFDFAGHKRQGDWQAALGVAYRVHHLSWVSMAGEAKRDYPASISYQSPWWQEYSVVEDHFARVNAVLTSGKPVVKIGVIHPVESYWLCFGPADQTAPERAERDQQFFDLIKWMLYGFNDFDFICESLLPSQKNESENGGFRVGEMEYEVIVVPNMRTIRGTTLQRLEAFADAGGRIVFAGEIPSLVDAEKSDAPAKLAARCEAISFTKTTLQNVLSEDSDIRLLGEDGVQVNGCLHQLRQDGDERYLFICNTNKQAPLHNLSLQINGDWQITLLNTSDGSEEEVSATYANNLTSVPCELAAHGSLLLNLKPDRRETGKSLISSRYREVTRLHGPVPVTLSEPNVMLFEKAQWRVGDGQWQETRQILDLDPIIRKELDMPIIHGHMAQPWTDQQSADVVDTVQLRLPFVSEVAVQSPQLALENSVNTTIKLDGKPVAGELTGYFTDEAIQTVKLPDFGPGEHILGLTVNYTRKTYLEWMYLLGDFGVQIMGDSAKIIASVRELNFGDWTTQGLPFYAGNVTYHCSLPQSADFNALRIPYFNGALAKVQTGDREIPLAFAPFRAELDADEQPQKLDITLFGTRINAFGQVHNYAWKVNPHYRWWGPDSWRTNGDDWSDEYVLRPCGILSGPILETY